MTNQRGTSLMETLVGLALLGAIGSAFLTTISSGLLYGGIVQESYTAQNLARTQMEEIKSLPYSDTGYYPVAVSSSGDLGISIAVLDESPTEYPNTLQRITVRISYGEKQSLVVESYKAKL